MPNQAVVFPDVDRRPAVVALRRATPDDAELILGWRGDPGMRRYQPLRLLSTAELRGQLAERAARVVDPRLDGEVQWIVEAGDGPVGWITLKDIGREHGLGAIGYAIAERLRGRGYATAAVRALLPLAFGRDAADLWRLEAVAAVENTSSRRVLERAGFAFEGIARQYLLIAGDRVDHARYALLRSNWEWKTRGSEMMGEVVAIHLADEAGAPMRALAEAAATAGAGLEGDRYRSGVGFYSGRPGGGRQLTMIEVEALEALEALASEAGIALNAGESRRNVTTRGVRLNNLVGKRFAVGEVVCQGVRLCPPCIHLEELTGKPVMRPLIDRGGLRADILVGGTIRVGDAVREMDGA